MSMRTLFCILVLLTLCALPASAQFDNVADRGFNAETAFQVGEFDAVNAMNGNLTLTVPLGQTYRSTGTLEYRFTLVYNSQFWDYWQHGERDENPMRWMVPVVGARMPWNNMVRLSWEAPTGQTPDPDKPGLTGMEAYPSKLSNAGLGWMATLGELEHGLTYVAPDGSRHEFFPNLHERSETRFPVDPNLQKLFTRDGSYIRLTKVAWANGRHERDVEFPDGTKKRFYCNDNDSAAPCTDGELSDWYLSSISDPYGNVLEVTRPARPVTGRWLWTFTEKTNGIVLRTHELEFEVLPLPRANSGSGKYELRLLFARLEKFGGGKAQYALQYKPGNTTVYRDHGSEWSAAHDLRAPYPPNTENNSEARKIEVSFLEKVTLPAGGGDWSFIYDHIQPSQNQFLRMSEGPEGKFFVTSDSDGYLHSATPPAGATVTYEYGPRVIPSHRCVNPVGSGPRPVHAVKKRKITGARTVDGQPVEDVWNYDSSFHFEQINGCNTPRELRTSIAAPDGAVTVNYYSVYRGSPIDNSPAAWRAAEYGLPFTRNVDDDAGRYLSSETYSCKDLSASQLEDVLGSANSLTGCQTLRRRFVLYEYGSIECPINSAATEETDCVASDPRVKSEATYYVDDGDAFTSVDYSDYDGLGHYRRTVTGGNLLLKSFSRQGDKKVTYRRYNPGVSYQFPPSESTQWNPGSEWIRDRWLLETYDRDVVSVGEDGNDQNVEARKSGYQFDQTTGRLLRKRIYKNTAANAARDDVSASNNDVVIEYQRRVADADQRNVILTERYFGGDLMALGLADVSNAGLLNGLKPEYILQTRLRAGNVFLREYLNCDSIFLTLENNSVDIPTGLVQSSTDASNATTSYFYDALGRLTSVTPPGEKPFTYQYQARPAKVTMSRNDTASNPALTDAAEWGFDGLGRLTSEKQWIPTPKADDGPTAGRMNVRYISYDAVGRKATASAVHWEGTVPPGEQRYSYDTLGRTTREQYIDLSATPAALVSETNYSYVGARQTTVHTPPLAPRVSHTDGLGRLVAVTENNSSHFAYRYNAADQVVGVYDGETGGNPRLPDVNSPNRRRIKFFYDGLGRLREEYFPELGGDTTYGRYDSRGHLGSRQNVVETRYLYDAAERLTQVTDSFDIPLKTFSYYPVSTGSESGKLASSTRLNRILDPGDIATSCSFEVTNGYQYAGVGGRVSKITLNATKPATNGCKTFMPFATSVDYEYDTFGSIKSMNYGGASLALRREGRYLKNVKRGDGLVYVDNVSYDAHGAVNRLVHGNRTKDVLSSADNGLPRVHMIQMLDDVGEVDWQHGPILYDRAGNITDVHNLSSKDHYTYDGLGRLDSARLTDRPIQRYGYDRFGNLTGIDSTGFSVNANKNRIELPGVTYDREGNITGLPAKVDNGPTFHRYQYDAFNNMKRSYADKIGRVFLYDADNERVAVLDYRENGKVAEQWTLRGIDKKPLLDTDRTTVNSIATTTNTKRYIYADGRPVAHVTRDPRPAAPVEVHRHLHLDHLGSVRVVTNEAAKKVSELVLAPYGEQIGGTAESGRLKFTGHERDEDLVDGGAGDLDYMHARYYAPSWGRFLSVDPTIRSAIQASPQTWNRVQYANNSPVSFTDPDGLKPKGLLARGFDAVEDIMKRAGLKIQVRQTIGASVKAGKLKVGVEFDPGKKTRTPQADGTVRVQGTATVSATVEVGDFSTGPKLEETNTYYVDSSGKPVDAKNPTRSWGDVFSNVDLGWDGAEGSRKAVSVGAGGEVSVGIGPLEIGVELRDWGPHYTPVTNYTPVPTSVIRSCPSCSIQ